MITVYLLISWEWIVTEPQDSFSKTTQLEVGLVESISPVRRHLLFLAVNKDRRTAINDALRCAFHYQQVLTATFQVMDRYLYYTDRCDYIENRIKLKKVDKMSQSKSKNEKPISRKKHAKKYMQQQH